MAERGQDQAQEHEDDAASGGDSTFVKLVSR
jgi:hypothetical protein